MTHYICRTCGRHFQEVSLYSIHRDIHLFTDEDEQDPARREED